MKGVISYGPCQFPTLGFIVERHLRRELFQSEKFWTLSCEYEQQDDDESSGKICCNFLWDRRRLFDRYACTILFETCMILYYDIKLCS